MAQLYAYNYAEIDDATNMCIGVVSSTASDEAGPTGSGTTFVLIPEYNEDYIFKYYIDGAWFEDANGTIPYIPA